jgi:hypothetical protein
VLLTCVFVRILVNNHSTFRKLALLPSAYRTEYL